MYKIYSLPKSIKLIMENIKINLVAKFIVIYKNLNEQLQSELENNNLMNHRRINTKHALKKLFIFC